MRGKRKWAGSELNTRHSDFQDSHREIHGISGKLALMLSSGVRSGATMSKERLPNSPLAQVACEIRFPGHFAATDGLARFQSAVEDQFPTLYVPRVQSGEAPALRAAQLVSADESERINVAIHLFSFDSRKYSVFAEYRARFLNLLTRFFEIHRPRELTRFGLRYKNVLPWQGASTEQLHPWLTLGFRVPTVMEREVSHINGTMILRYDHGALRVTLERQEAEVRATQEQVADTFVVDLDFFRTGSIPLEELEGMMDKGHRTIEDVFFALLSQEGLNAMKGTE
jgi:uncharacterized protein (TIGR04255 family)